MSTSRPVALSDTTPRLPERDLRTPPENVLAVVLDVLRAVGGGSATEDAVCCCLARAVDAVLVAYVALSPGSGAAHVVAWSSSLDPVQVRDLLGPHPGGLHALFDRMSPEREVHCRSTGEGVGRNLDHRGPPDPTSLRCPELAVVPLNLAGPVHRVVVLGTAGTFRRPAVQLLECLRGPLADVIRIAGEQPLPAAATGPADRLTGREVEVLRLTAQGLLARTIGLRLQVSTRTVHKHLGSVYRKLDVHDRLLAVRRAEALGLLASPAPPLGRSESDSPTSGTCTHRSSPASPPSVTPCCN